MKVRYLGDAHVEASQDTATVIVDPADKVVPQLGIAHTPKKVVAQKTRARLIVRMSRPAKQPGDRLHRDPDPGHGQRRGHLHLGPPAARPGGSTTAEVPGPRCQADPGHLSGQRHDRSQGRVPHDRGPAEEEVSHRLAFWGGQPPVRRA